MPFAFSVADVIPATPRAIYDAWLDSEGHAAMTGSRRAKCSTGKGAKHEDSEIEVLLEPVARGTKVTVNHTNVPDGHTSYRDGGWQKSYFEPMKRYFSSKR